MNDTERDTLIRERDEAIRRGDELRELLVRELVTALADVVEADGARRLSGETHRDRQLYVSNTHALPITLQGLIVDLLADMVDVELRTRQLPEGRRPAP